MGIFSQMFAKIEYMYFMGEKSKDTYTAEEFVEELNRRVWAPTREGRVLSMVERSRQNIMVGLMSASTGLLPGPSPECSGWRCWTTTIGGWGLILPYISGSFE